MWTDNVTLQPLNGFIFLKSSSIARKSGIFRHAQAIFFSPEGAKDKSLTSLGYGAAEAALEGAWLAPGGG
jgi:hypothetical protein